jgi:hypothetical protein
MRTMRMRCPWLGGVVVGKGRAVKTFICTYIHLWGRSDGRPTNTGQRSGSGLHVDLSRFHGKVPFPEDEIVSRDPDRRLANSYHTRPADVYSGVPVTARSQVSSSFIGNSALRECLDSHHSYILTLPDRIPFLFFLFCPYHHRRHSPHHRPAFTEVQRAVHGLTQTSRPDLTQTKHDTYHRRSSIADHDHHPLLQLASGQHPTMGITNTLEEQ